MGAGLNSQGPWDFSPEAAGQEPGTWGHQLEAEQQSVAAPAEFQAVCSVGSLTLSLASLVLGYST